jgi:hypothetical protein
MASESTTQRETTTTRSRAANGGEASEDTMQTAVREVRGAIEGVSRSVPDVARASRTAVDDLFRAIETGSDERVTAGVSLSLGLALGMLLGGAPRLLIIIALAPVVAAGLVLADRRSRTSGGSTRATG